MEKKALRGWCAAATLLTFLLATFWHFLYSDFLRCYIAAAIAPVNESPWEHAKLFFLPAVITYLILYLIIGRKFENFVFSHAVSLLIMPFLMLLLFYAYQLVIPENLAADIALTYIVIAIGQLIAYKMTVSGTKLSGAVFKAASALIVLGLLVLFAVLTFFPPHCGIFFDSNSMRYGI